MKKQIIFTFHENYISIENNSDYEIKIKDFKIYNNINTVTITKVKLSNYFNRAIKNIELKELKISVKPSS